MFEALIAVAGLLAGLAVGYLLHKHLSGKRVGDAHELADRIVQEARKEAGALKKELRLQAQDEIYAQKKEQEKEFKDRESSLKKQENRLQEKEERLEGKLEKVASKESEVNQLEKRLIKLEKELEDRQLELEKQYDEHDRKLQEISGLTKEEAREKLMTEIESRTRHEAGKMVRAIEVEARETADKKAKEILSLALQRYAGRLHQRAYGHCRDLAFRRHEGAHHRPRRSQYPRPGSSHRRGPDHRRHDPRPWCFRHSAPCAREVAKLALERLIHDGPHPSRAHRGHRQEGRAGA